MKKAITFVAAIILLFSACKKENKSVEPAPFTPTTPSVTQPTLEVEFFVDANKYDVREPFDYPSGSPAFADANNPFHILGSSNVCTTTGKKIVIKYSNSDTTLCSFWFYKTANPDVYMGTCDLKIAKTGDVILSYGSVPGSTVTPYLATCKKAVVFN